MPEAVNTAEPDAPQGYDRFTAPGALEMLQCFANTIDVETSRDELHDASGLRGWLLEHDLISPRERVSADDLRDALELRTAVRSLSHANHGEPSPPEAIRTLDRIADAANLQARFRAGEPPLLEPNAKGAAGALGRLVAIAFAAMSEGTWRRLKICRSDDCAVVFYDHSKNQSRAWCSMKVCGNRTKVRNFRRRARSS
jgi:predicted RNA-binding Zn ribbon-like protein